MQSKFLTPDEVAALEAIAGRLIPADELGPGAAEAGAVDFIERALGSFYREARAAYRAGLAGLDRAARERFDRRFVALRPEEQDSLLAALERGAVAGFDPSGGHQFFELVRRHVLEGLLADPIYGGNRDFIGWRLVNFPGAVASYTAEEMQAGRPLERPFTSVADVQEGAV